MGSMITLRLGRLEVDWGKNNAFINHSPLFRATDVAEADYYYADDVVERKPAYVRELRHIMPRLELLGFSLKGCRRVYQATIDRIPNYYPKMSISFDTFVRRYGLSISTECGRIKYEREFDLGEFASFLLRDQAFQRVMPEG